MLTAVHRCDRARANKRRKKDKDVKEAARQFSEKYMFPIAMLSTGIWAIWSYRNIGDPNLAVYLPLLWIVPIVLFEWFSPFRKDWATSWKHDSREDIAHFIGNNVVSRLAYPVINLPIVLLMVHFAEGVGFSLWPSDAHIALQIVLAIVVADFGVYWYHRALHHFSPLWSFHSIHHAPEKMNCSKGLRFHFIDGVLHGAVLYAPLVFLGAPTEVYIAHAAILQINGFFQHSNMNIFLGPLNYFFAGAEIHRLHHRKSSNEARVNYGTVCIVWDVMFGTFARNSAEYVSQIDIGVTDPDFPKSYFGQLMEPFRVAKYTTLPFQGATKNE